MTPLDRLAEVVAKMPIGPWGFHDKDNPGCITAGKDSTGAFEYLECDDIAAEGATVILNVADALIAVARAVQKEDRYRSCAHGWGEECSSCALSVLNAAIVKALGDKV